MSEDYDEVPEIDLDERPDDYDEHIVNVLRELDETIPEAFEENIKKKVEEEKQIKELEEIDIDDKVKEAKGKGIISKISGIKQEWMNVFNDRSYFNELPGEIIFHVLFGQIMRNKKFYKGNKPINLKCSFFWCQESGSGKGEGVDVLTDTIKEVNKIINEKKETLKELKKLVVGEFKGTETDAVLLNRFEYKEDKRKGYNFEIPQIPGEFELNDFYIYREARVLLEKERYREQTATYFLDILEDTPIVKKLEGWSGNGTETHAQGSLIATTVPLTSMSVFIANTGLIQRTLTCMRLLTRDTRRDMTNKDAMISGQEQTISSKNRELYEARIRKIAKDLITIYEKYKDKDINIKNPKEVSGYILQRMDELNERIDTELRKYEYKNIARSFVGRYPLHIMKLMYQNCMLRGGEEIELEDVTSAFDLMYKSYSLLENWLQDTLKLDRKRTEDEVNITAIINKEINARTTKLVSYDDMIIALTTKAFLSKDRAKIILKDEMTYGKRSPFIVLGYNRQKFITKRGQKYDEIYTNLTDNEFNK